MPGDDQVDRSNSMVTEQAEAAVEAAAMSDAPEKEKMVLIAASGDLDKAWPVLILATTGAAYGMDVTRTRWHRCRSCSSSPRTWA